MTTSLFHVIKYEDIPYEKHNKDVVYSSLSLQEAIDGAKEIIRKEFFSKFFLDSFSKDYFIPALTDLTNVSSDITIFPTNNSYLYGESSIYVVEVKLNEPVNLYKVKACDALWTINEPFLFELFTECLDKIMARDALPMLPSEEKTRFWSLFKKDPKSFQNSERGNFRFDAIKTYPDLNQTGYELWSKTIDDQKEAELFEIYELNK